MKVHSFPTVAFVRCNRQPRRPAFERDCDHVVEPAFQITSATTFSVARGAQQTVTARFSPTGAGVQTGTLSIQSNDPTQPAIKMQLTATGLAAAGPLVLQVDGGTFAGSIGFPNGASTAYFVNRLTPPKYQATLQSVQVYFGDRRNG